MSAENMPTISQSRRLISQADVQPDYECTTVHHEDEAVCRRRGVQG
jgi:hypothetical protein